ncbi:MAG: hypothetical protein H6738_00060 [Alphaproteobacteria bacterium]|nr:hypothetical protein [Alphaproteobacteria bacterium]MCB9695163.1 hypothetical protein [Alphaproteobacteria bacterium]
MGDRDRDQRRAKKLAKQKKRRANASRPARSPADVARDPSQGQHWPVGECWVSQDWDQPGARLAVILSRVSEGGAAVVAAFTLDRSGPGVVTAEAIGGLRSVHVQGQAARLSEQLGSPMMEVAPGLAAELVRDAALNGEGELPDGWEEASALLSGIGAIDIGVPFGPEAQEPPKPGLLQRMRSWIGS